jgi:hypothetical protein
MSAARVALAAGAAVAGAGIGFASGRSMIGAATAVVLLAAANGYSKAYSP